MKEILWHSLNNKEVIEKLETNFEKGLTSEQVAQRIKEYGENTITPKKQQSALVRFLLQFHQPLIYILLAATFITILLREYIDASVIFAVVLVNSIIGYIQETKALKAIDALTKSMVSKATVRRNGETLQIDGIHLVPGDIVLLQSGDKIPADIRLLKQRDLKVDESALTGESVSAEKSTNTVAPDTILGDRANIGFATTVVTYGTATGVVVNTGDKTEVGKISQSISSAEEIETPLTKKIKAFSNLLLWAILALAAATFAFGIYRGENLSHMFMVSVALAVGAIPEGLPAAVTIMLAIGVSKMAKRRAIIRKLVAVETLGSTTVICSDKTGTLTENQMTVQKISAGNEIYEVTGIGYKPEGEILFKEEKVDLASNKALEYALIAGFLCNDTQLKEDNNYWKIEGDPTEGAMLVSALKAGYDPKSLNQGYPRFDTIPFESEYQYMATLHESNESLIFMKGSMEAILNSCSERMAADGSLLPLDKNVIVEVSESLAQEGLRVLAFAYKKAAAGLRDITHKDVSAGLTFLGLQGMIDPPRKEAMEAVSLCQKAGIQVKMITGDHALTASSIAAQIGLTGKIEDGKLKTITGKELQKLSDNEIMQIAQEVSVFARVTPDQKLRLVKGLQASQNVVAMTGDGVNDGPALKQADIGIAMGITGTDVAKDAADMVLTDDNFSSIEGAVEEGRGVLDNLTKFIVWTLPTNLGEGLIVLISVILGSQLPLQPVQILWINMTTSVLLGLMLTFEPKEPGIMDRPPSPPNNPILTYPLIMRTLLVGTLLMIAAFFLFEYEISIGNSLAEAQTVASTVFVVLEAAYLFNCRSLRRSINEIGWFSNHYVFYGIIIMMFLQILFIYTPVMNDLFHTHSISLMAWLRIVGAAIALFVIVSIEKMIRRRFSNSKVEEY